MIITNYNGQICGICQKFRFINLQLTKNDKMSFTSINLGKNKKLNRFVVVF